MSDVFVIIHYRSLPGQEDSAKQGIDDLIGTVLAREPDCGGITFLQDADDPTRFTLIERWPSRDHFLGPHMQQPHIQAFIQTAGALLGGPPEITFWQVANHD